MGIPKREFPCDNTCRYERSAQLGNLWGSGNGSSRTASDVGPELEFGGHVFDLSDGADVAGSKAGNPYLRAGAGFFRSEPRTTLPGQCA